MRWLRSLLRGSGLRSRIVRTTAATSMLVTIIAIVVTIWQLDRVEHSTVRRTLLNQASVVAAQIPGAAWSGGPVTLPDDALSDTTWIFTPHGRLVQGPHTPDHVTDVALRVRTARPDHVVYDDDRAFMSHTVTEDAGHTVAVVVVEHSVDMYESMRHAVSEALVGFGILAMLGVTTVAAWATRRTLAPVSSMVESAELWSASDLEARFDVGDSRDEVSELGRSLNVLVERVAAAIRSEQRLTSELAHELRTPLTAIRGEAELARLNSTSPEVAERLDVIVALVDQMSTTITSLLAVARSRESNAGATDVADVVRAVLAERPEHERVPIQVVEIREGVMTTAPLTLAQRALAPLVDNAVAHARTGVQLRLEVGTAIRIVVEDDGPGMDESPTPGGSGLGLPLARRIATSIGGRVAVASPRDPTRVALTVPMTRVRQ